jgi:hypothetical protein
MELDTNEKITQILGGQVDGSRIQVYLKNFSAGCETLALIRLRAAGVAKAAGHRRKLDRL